MIKIMVRDLINYCDCKILIGNEDVEIKECFIDSRIKTDGGTFFGIKGLNVDGSLFYKEAFDNGAKVCVISKIIDLDLNGYDDKTVVIAKDPANSLKLLAAYKRSLFNGTVIGITGSVGKTTTKEMIYNVLKLNYNVLKTIGNQNSQLGLPLTILRLADEDVMLLEMGMSMEGEMHKLSMIAKPDIAIITNVFDSHVGNLGSRENILKEKLTITDGMQKGILIINNDNDMLKKVNYVNEMIDIMSFGVENKSNVMSHEINEGVKTTFSIGDVDGFKISGSKALVYNALIAYLVGKLMGVSRSMIKIGINEYENQNHRLEVIRKNGITIIDDSYNASYESVKAALEYIKNFKGKKIVVLGDILELGKESKRIHKNVGKLINACFVDNLITIGKHSKLIKKQAQKNGVKSKNIKHFKNENKSRKYIMSLLEDGVVLLVKGSNGVGLVNLINYIIN